MVINEDAPVVLEHHIEIFAPPEKVFLLRVQWPGLSNAEAIGNIERIGKIIAELS